MIDISFDLSDTVSEFRLSQEETKAFSNYVLDRVTDEFMEQWENVINTQLKSSRDEYKRAIYQDRPDDNTSIIGLTSRNSKLAMMIELGASAFDEKCIVNPRTKIYTSKGYQSIANIKVGDLVLTKLGKFKRVSSLFKVENKDEFIFKIYPIFNTKMDMERGFLCVTGNHPILTDKGWKIVKDLDPVIDKVVVTALKCINCGKLTPVSNLDVKNICCASSCRGHLTYKSLKEWQDREAKGNPAWGMGSLSVEKRREMHKSSSRNYGMGRGSSPENILWEEIKGISGIERQFPFERDVKCEKINRNRFYYFDFAIPEHKICIEVNGEHWHTKEEDLSKKREIELKGWRYLSFWSKEVYSDKKKCVDEIFRVLGNHEGNYEFIETSFLIQKIDITTRKKFNHTYNIKYNLTVEDDSSYIANSIVTHNSGFANSDKKHIKSDGVGWYLTIPFRHAVSEAIMSEMVPGTKTSVIDLLKTGEKLTPKTLPEGRQEVQTHEVEFAPGITMTYKHKSPIYEGLHRRDIASTEKEKRGGYFTFRRVSDKSEDESWLHPGFTTYDLMGKALQNTKFDQIVDLAVQEFLDQKFG